MGFFSNQSSSAVFSKDRRYRYLLTRRWNNDKPAVCFIMLNPSTADENKNDATIRKCIAFAELWGFGGLIVANLFALRSTNPAALYKHENPIGETVAEANAAIYKAAMRSGMVVAAWGQHGGYLDRDKQVCKLLDKYASRPRCLKLTKKGKPYHPLYVPMTAKLLLYKVA